METGRKRWKILTEYRQKMTERYGKRQKFPWKNGDLWKVLRRFGFIIVVTRK